MSDDDFCTATGAQLARRLYHAAMACDGHPDIGRPLARLVAGWERRCTWRLALVEAADAVCPDWRSHPWAAGNRIAAMLADFDPVAIRRVKLGYRQPNATERVLLPLLDGPRSDRALGGALIEIAISETGVIQSRNSNRE